MDLNKKEGFSQSDFEQEDQLPVCDMVHGDFDFNDIKSRMPEDGEFIEAATLFQQLSDSTRLRILWILTHEEICVYDISLFLGMSAPAVSHHLRSLRQLGLIQFRREGKHVYYSLSDSADAKHIRHILADAFEENWND